jgi:outer membrane protein TolC
MSFMKKLLAVLGLFAGMGGLVCAETALTVDAAVESALKNNISVERSKLSLSTLERKSGKSWNELFPSLSVGAGVSKGNKADTATAYGMASVSLSVSPAIIQSINQARLNYEAGRISYDTALRDVELSVRKAFYSLIYEREYVELLKKNLTTAEKQYQQTLANQKVGLVPELDVLSAQVALENIRPNLASAEVSFQNDIAAFKQTLGIDQKESISLDGTLDDALALKSIDLSSVSVASPTVAALEKKLELARVSKSLAWSSACLPTFSLSWNYKPTGLLKDGAEFEDAGYASASVTLPLDGFLPWTSMNEAVQSANDSVKDLELQLASARTSLTLNVDSLLRSIDKSHTTLAARKLNVQLAEKTYAMMEDAYRRGTKDLLTLQNSGDSLDEAKVTMMKESYTLLAAVLDLEYAVGVPFGTLGR